MGIFSNDGYISIREDIENIIKNSDKLTKEEIIEKLKLSLKSADELDNF